MAETKTFNNVTAEIFSCSKRKVGEYNKVKYDPPDANQGNLTMTVEGHIFSTPSTFDLGFDFNPATGDLVYTLINIIKQGSFPVATAWDRLGEAIDFCRGQGYVRIK